MFINCFPVTGKLCQTVFGKVNETQNTEKICLTKKQFSACDESLCKRD